jgi:hypothetical protein
MPDYHWKRQDPEIGRLSLSLLILSELPAQALRWLSCTLCIPVFSLHALLPNLRTIPSVIWLQLHSFYDFITVMAHALGPIRIDLDSSNRGPHGGHLSTPANSTSGNIS